MTASLPSQTALERLEVGTGWYGRTAFITIDGVLDFRTAAEGRRLLLDVLDRQPRALVVDVANAFVDSAGIGVLVHTAQRSRQERRSLELRCNGGLADILRLRGLGEILGIRVRRRIEPDRHAVHKIAA